MVSIREVQISDAPRLSEIYSYYVHNTAVSFEYEAHTQEEFMKRIMYTTEKYPYLVCVDDEKVVGYAYAGEYSARQAYDWTVTTSIYVDKDYRRKGIGTLLYDELGKRLKDQEIVNLLAGVAACDDEDEYLTPDSSRFHISKGYTQVAHMKKVGKKFGKWYDLLWYQKRL